MRDRGNMLTIRNMDSETKQVFNQRLAVLASTHLQGEVITQLQSEYPDYTLKPNSVRSHAWRNGIRFSDKVLKVADIVPGQTLGMTEEVTPSDPVEEADPVEADSRVVSLRKQLAKVDVERKALRRENKLLVDSSNKVDKLREWLTDSVPVMEPGPYHKPNIKAESKTAMEMVYFWTDHHVGQVVSDAQTSGFGHYDLKTWLARMDYLIKSSLAIKKDVERGHPVKKLTLFLGGDMVNGFIHDVEKVDIGHPNAHLLGAAQIYAESIRIYATEFETVHVPCVVGNHGRMIKEPHFGGDKVIANLDFLMYEMIKVMCSALPNVTFDIPISYFVEWEIFGNKWVGMHGDTVKSYSDIPLYGIKRHVSRMADLFGIREEIVNYWVMGHFHHSSYLQTATGGIFLNGTSKGADEYTIQKIATANDPQQTLLTLHPKHGVWGTHNINLRGIYGESMFDWPFERYGIEEPNG